MFFLFLWLLVGCVTNSSNLPSKVTNWQKFPVTFEGTQQVVIRTDQGEHQFTVQLRRTPGLLHWVVLEPTFLTPVAIVKTDGIDSQIKWVRKIQKSVPLDLQVLSRQIFQFYDAKSFRVQHDVHHWQSADKDLQYKILRIKNNDGCAFPEVIEITHQNISGLRIRVTTEDISC